MRYFLTILCLGTFISLSQADIQMPPKPTFYDKAGTALANIAFSPAELLDSTYELTLTEGPTVGYSVGLVRGASRMVMDIFVGTFDLITSPFPTQTIKMPALDSGQIDPVPPADLIHNWY
ncbi:MAG: exosortase system-associated protein, TIGR04073 family [Verrucomicrobiota bacterium]